MSPIVVDFPLRGEWGAPISPKHKVPSHGTDALGMTYAFDFVRYGWQDDKPRDFHHRSRLSYWAGRVKLSDCYGWGQPIHAPFSGTVIEAKDGWPERKRLHFVSDFGVAMKNGILFSYGRADLRALAGNHIILEGNEACAFIAHARTGSLRVKPRSPVNIGDILAEVGHSGNSTAPHLHFQLMDRPDLHKAKGLQCCFRRYEQFVDGEWIEIKEGIPGELDRIRL